MTTAQDLAVDVFVAAGLIARDADILAVAGAELVRAMGLDQLCFGAHHDGACPTCGHKTPPGDPHPIPPPPPPPPPGQK